MKQNNTFLDKNINSLAISLKRLINSSKKIATVESCTGGMVAAALTSVSGSSNYFHSAIITYSNEAKIKLANVLPATIAKYGAVSEEVAREMAKGYFLKQGLDLTVSITGIAGPGGGGKDKPVGTVCFSIYDGNKLASYSKFFEGDREEIRKKATIFALELLNNYFK